MVPLNLSASSSATGKQDTSASWYGVSGGGDWNVNLGSSGGALNGLGAGLSTGGGGGFPPVLLIGLALVAVWFILKK